MSPIHHHFELAGWPEFTVIVRFWIIAGLCVAVGLGLYYADFIARGRPGMSGRFAGERAVVVGAGVAGAAAARGARGRGRAGAGERGPSRRTRSARRELRARGVRLLAGGHDPAHLDDATLVVTGPGVPPSAEVLGWVRERGLPLWGELELGARVADAPYLAVTGTNGKTTTTAMLAACLRAGGLDAVACGNIGHPFPDGGARGARRARGRGVLVPARACRPRSTRGSPCC